MEVGLFFTLVWMLFLLIFSWEVMTEGRDELQILLEIKASLDPHGQVLRSWQKGKNPCGGDFLGISCNDAGEVSSLSLQGQGLTGSIPAVVAELASLTGLYLHYNSLEGQIPGTALARLKALTEIYLNVNKLSGSIPPELGSISNLQVLQLCCNALSGRIPEELGQLSQLHILELDYNGLTDNIPLSFGGLTSLTHLGLSFNKLTGSIPIVLCNLTLLTVLDVRNNNFSGSTPDAFHRLQEGFSYTDNPLLCGEGFFGMPACGLSQALPRPEPLGALTPALSVPYLSSAHGEPKSPLPNRQIKHTSKVTEVAVVGGVVAITFGVVISILMSLVWLRRHKQRISSTFEATGTKCGVNTIPENHLEYGVRKYDTSPFKEAFAQQSILFRKLPGAHSGKGLKTYCNYKLEELELATNFFSNKNLLGKSTYAATFKGTLNDGSLVVIKNLAKTSFAVGDTQLQEALEMLSCLRHENLVTLRGFCCLGGGRQCYLVYDFIPNGTLHDHLRGARDSLLDWPMRVHIAHGIAKGLNYLYARSKETFIQHTVWASNIFLDDNYNAMISGCGQSRIQADEVVYANIKRSATLGYLAPEYGLIGYLNEKSDVFAFGILLLELLTGIPPPDIRGMNLSGTNLSGNCINSLLDVENLHKLVDPSLGGKYPVAGIMGLASIAFSCTAEAPHQRPVMAQVVQLLCEIESLVDVAPDGGCSSSGEEYPSQQAEYVRMLDHGR